MFKIRLVRVPAVEVVYNLLCILEPGGGGFRKFVVFNPFNSVGADGPNRRTVKRMCVSECIVVVIQSVFYLRIG
jgi:hypothetical protein